MKNIGTTSEIVREILEEFPATRNSDNLLYIKVVERIDKKLIYKPMVDLFTNSKKYGVPPFESVRRSRQKLQADNPWLKANETVAAERLVNEQIVEAYAIGTDCAWK